MTSGQIGIREHAAIVVANAAGAASRITGRGGGSSLPGVIARRLSPSLLTDLVTGRQVEVLAITGSNGKTTTARFVSAILRGQGVSAAQNRDGANLVQGVTTLAVQTAGWRGKIHDKTVLVVEVDEGALRLVAPEIRPRVLTVTNLFRDQLDRFGEIYAVADVIAYAARGLPDSATVVINADDPLTAQLPLGDNHPRMTFGLEIPRSFGRITSAADSIRCPQCQSGLEYTYVYLSHLGDYRCTRCGLARPPLDVAVTGLEVDGLTATTVQLRTPRGEFSIRVPQAGVHIAYDVAAAVATVVAAGYSAANAPSSLRNVKAAFGRFESVSAGDREVLLAFAKNPTSFNTNLSTLADVAEPRHLLLAVSNTRVDGEDFGWLWDVDFESIVSNVERLTISGLRADELATRLKYAGVSVAQTAVIPDRAAALSAALAHVPRDGRLVSLAGYTPTIEIREAMRARGWVGRRWDAA